MFKPTVIGPIANGFSEQEVQVGISIDVIDKEDKSPFKVFVQIEPQEIVPLEDQLIKDHEFYDLILTWNEEVLSSCPNATKFIFGSCRFAADPKDDADMSKKNFSASYLTSSKTMCTGHYFRHEVFSKLPSVVGTVPIIKHMSPPEIEKKDMLYPFQFSVIMENVKRNNWVTEKLIDCIVSRTLPIYWGAPNVGEYFNIDGIFSFSTYQELLGILENLTPEVYNNHLSAVEDNLHRAMKYTNFHTRVDEEIRRRLSEHHLRTSGDIGTRQKVREPVLGQQPSESRRFHRPIRERIR